jgi:Zn-dependent M28 family amino/carboxypeptidase
MRYSITILLLVAFSKIQAQQDTTVRVLFRRVVSVLASDSLKGRATASPEIELALSFLQKEFKSVTGKKLRTQKFTILLKDSSVVSATNAYFFFNNHSKHTVIIGAHYDHIGLGGGLSKSFQSTVVHNGADDNASGVAMTLALARQLAHRKSNVNYLFVFYSGHEIGLYGSTSFYKELVLSSKKFGTIDRVFNFDMIGRLDYTSHIMRCVTFPSKDSLMYRLPDMHGIDVREGNNEVLLKLDTKVYVEAGIPTIHLTTGVHFDYHRPTDDAPFIHYDGMQQIYELLCELFLCYPLSSALPSPPSELKE